ncbi:hypothetical protein NO263_01980 [Gluconacetobacter entanii]|uniref:Uncharacterized protein n=1 Tax=Gluconacetobacter entanii TaxID=108528 RepID=A0ABT3K1S9_9PROT|nr:hypothetical protein [Gluconacetobacter entanii]MCW4589358.1 hypothetical protein [Gluconacetobacter entanii]MCW4592989.1 hypothetical protein [Gluconacetobacter entanii]NPC90234.1 hypothetical protein [Gluconacetobacter entanii]
MIGCCYSPPPRGPRPGTVALFIVAGALIVSALAGCTQPVVRPQCIPLKAVSKADENTLADELDATPDMPALHDMARDWVRMRDEDRVCLKKARSRE